MPLVATTAVQLLHPRSEEGLGAGGGEHFIFHHLLPVRDAREQVGGVLGLIGFHQLEQHEQIFAAVKALARRGQQVSEEHGAARLLVPHDAAGEGLEQRAILGGRQRVEQLAERVGDDDIEVQPRDETFEAHLAQLDGVRDAVLRGQVRHGGTVNQFAEEHGPRTRRQRLAVE